MPESYKPGSRKPKYGVNPQISKDRYAWVQCEAGKFVIIVGEDNGHGPDVVLYHPRPGKILDVSIKLANLTLEELTALRELFNTAFDWAEPVVKQRDKEAQDAWEAGDDSHSRNYRPVPTVVYRKRPVGEHDEGVRERPESLPEGGIAGRDGDSGGVRGAGDDLVEPDPEDHGSEDDRTPPLESEVVGEVGEDASGDPR